MSKYIMIKFPDDLSIEESVDNMRTLERLGFDFQWMNGGTPINRDLFEYLPDRQPKKYYLISYIWNCRLDQKTIENEVIDISPVQWVIDVHEDKRHYRLVNVIEITKEQHDMYHEWDINHEEVA